jgi:hypothetical protein
VHPRLPYGIMSGTIVGDVKSNYLFNLIFDWNVYVQKTYRSRGAPDTA